MRYALAAFAVVLSTLLVPIGITATWLSLRVDNTKAYVDTVEPLAEEPELRDALAKEVADAAIATLEGNVPLGLLPDSVDTIVQRSTKDIVESDSFPEFWREANADAHKEFLAIVHERKEDVVADGYVIVDLRPLLDDVLTDFAAEFGIPANLLPSTPLPLPVVRESRLERPAGPTRRSTPWPGGSRWPGSAWSPSPSSSLPAYAAGCGSARRARSASLSAAAWSCCSPHRSPTSWSTRSRPRSRTWRGW